MIGTPILYVSKPYNNSLLMKYDLVGADLTQGIFIY